MLTFTWFRNDHEYRNDYIRFALMHGHDLGELAYRELPQAAGGDFGLPASLVDHVHRHTSFFLVEDEDGRRRTVAIDNEDGFTHMQPFIEDVDLYLCCPFSSAFHRGREFPETLPWQTEFDVASYRERAQTLIERYGDSFDKVRPLIPTPTSMTHVSAMSTAERTRQVWAHRSRKLSFWRADRELWRSDFAIYEARYRQMLRYRGLPLRHDVVSRESLWGWPENRIALHERLRSLRQDGRDVHSQLTPLGEAHDLSRNELAISEERLALLDELTVPMALDEPYEEALCTSRLGVFPTGFHWGWRGITFLALCAGIPVYMDRPVYEPYFDFDEFEVDYNDGQWEETAALLDAIDEERWLAVKAHNQRVFDDRLSPEAVRRYLNGELRRSLDKAAPVPQLNS